MCWQALKVSCTSDIAHATLHVDTTEISIRLLMNTILFMEVHRVADSSAQVADLFHPDCTVPSNDPNIPVSQPRPITRRRRRGRVLKSVRWPSIHLPTSTDNVLNTAWSQQATGSHGQINEATREHQMRNESDARALSAHQLQQTESVGNEAPPRTPSQSSSSPTTLEKVSTRTSMLRLLFWKRMKPHQISINEPPTHETPGSVPSVNGALPALVMVGHDVSPVLVVRDTVPSEANTSQPIPILGSPTTVSEAPVVDLNLSQALYQPPDLNQTQPTTASVIHDSSIGLEVPTTHTTTTAESNTVLEFIDSKKLYSPEQGVFVGKLYELPPPERARTEWCREIRPQLIRNLMTVIASLPPSFSRAETTIEPELCMSGRSLQGRPTVALTPTIWIRCGSKACQKAVRRAVADLSSVKRFPVYITLHAPRPASTGSAPFDRPRGLNIPRQDEADQVLPTVVELSTDSNSLNRIPLTLQRPLEICVEPFSGAQHSTCGLRVAFSTPDGKCYTSTLGGLLLLNDTVMGLTTAHAICDVETYVEGALHVETRDSLEITRQSIGEHDENKGVGTNENAVQAPLRATLFAARFGKALYSFMEATTKVVPTQDRHNHDFVLLQLHPEHSQNARTAYSTSRGNVIIDMISQDLNARPVHLVCSSENVASGRLLDGTCIILDKEGYWETRKIELDNPLSKYESRLCIPCDKSRG
jgi:hypothetical protein